MVCFDTICCYGNGLLSTLQVVYEVCSRLKDISRQRDKLLVCESCDSGPISLENNDVEDGTTMHHTANGLHKSCQLHTLFSSWDHSSSLQTRVQAIQVPTIPRLEASTWVSAIQVPTCRLVPSFQTGGWGLGTEHLSGSLDSSWSR